METFTLSGFFKFNSQSTKLGIFSYVPFGDGLPGLPASPHQSRDWVLGAGHISKASPVEDICLCRGIDEVPVSFLFM